MWYYARAQEALLDLQGSLNGPQNRACKADSMGPLAKRGHLRERPIENGQRLEKATENQKSTIQNVNYLDMRKFQGFPLK